MLRKNKFRIGIKILNRRKDNIKTHLTKLSSFTAENLDGTYKIDIQNKIENWIKLEDKMDELTIGYYKILKDEDVH